jgi:hypothetical protein
MIGMTRDELIASNNRLIAAIRKILAIGKTTGHSLDKCFEVMSVAEEANRVDGYKPRDGQNGY